MAVVGVEIELVAVPAVVLEAPIASVDVSVDDAEVAVNELLCGADIW